MVLALGKFALLVISVSITLFFLFVVMTFMYGITVRRVEYVLGLDGCDEDE